jgi:hypothetical protein
MTEHITMSHTEPSAANPSRTSTMEAGNRTGSLPCGDRAATPATGRAGPGQPSSPRRRELQGVAGRARPTYRCEDCHTRTRCLLLASSSRCVTVMPGTTGSTSKPGGPAIATTHPRGEGRAVEQRSKRVRRRGPQQPRQRFDVAHFIECAVRGVGVIGRCVSPPQRSPAVKFPARWVAHAQARENPRCGRVRMLPRKRRSAHNRPSAPTITGAAATRARIPASGGSTRSRGVFGRP